ncbi:MAG: ChaN family lipoprotein [Burkholderiaceae bacterium]|nr:ChaN family lipoprotein [Burkholderiaceae bacterium]
MNRSLRLLSALAVLSALGGCVTRPPKLDAELLAVEMARRPAVLLGEVHDNVLQHQARAQALGIQLQRGARPAIAFEQFDRERQADIDRARKEQPAAGGSLADHVIAQGRAARDQWDWARYRPFVELALQYGLPIVAANLSRTEAAKVSREGLQSVFADADLRRLGLDRADAALQGKHEAIVQAGHCNLLPPTALPGLARAQIARDAVLADSIRPFLVRGVVLLTGNGHARRDVGVPLHFSVEERQEIWSIGLLEEGTDEERTLFDAAFSTPVQQRDDPCQRVLPRAK